MTIVPPNAVSAFDVAEEVVVVETCPPRKARFAGGDAIRRDREMNPFLDTAIEPATLHMFRFVDVVLDRSHMVLLKDGRPIAETDYLQNAAELAALTVRPDDLIRPLVKHVVATCFDHWDANYYHWMAHTIPTLHAILSRHPRSDPDRLGPKSRKPHAILRALTGYDIGLVLPLPQPWQRRSLELMGASRLPAIPTEPGKQYFLPYVEYYTYVTGAADFAVSALSRAAGARLAASVPGGTRPGRKIYIDRTNARNRRIPNEPALMERLARRGFDFVRLEDMSLEQQIATFRDAAMVVSQHGAGLANIAFCNPGTVVYELVPEHHRNPCFLVMAMQGDLAYWADMFPTGVGTGDHTSPWTIGIDIDRAMRRIEELERLAPLP